MARPIDHLVLAVRDLDAAGDFYARLGFQVGTRNRHPWGTENRIVQFDGSFLELITVGAGADIPPHGPRAFSFGAFVRDYLARNEGLAMLVLATTDARADAAAFAAAGIGDYEPFFFERKGKRLDGSDVHVAFTLAFAREPSLPEAAFFVCQQHFPDAFWNGAAQVHANGAHGVASVALVCENPSDHHIFLEAFTGLRDPHSTSLGVSFALPRGQIDALTPVAAAQRYGADALPQDGMGRFAGYVVAVADLPATVARLEAANIPHTMVAGRAVVPASFAFGTAIAFMQA